MGMLNSGAIKEIHKGALGHLVEDHKMDLSTLRRDYRCVHKRLVSGGGSLMRVFRPADVKECGVTVTGWDTFDAHPELIVFDGFLMGDGQDDAHLERRRN